MLFFGPVLRDYFPYAHLFLEESVPLRILLGCKSNPYDITNIFEKGLVFASSAVLANILSKTFQ